MYQNRRVKFRFFTCKEAIQIFFGDNQILVLLAIDNNYRQNHTLKELCTLTPLVRTRSNVVVAESITEEMSLDDYPDRTWSHGNNPCTAIIEFPKLGFDFTTGLAVVKYRHHA